jgi:hypothetical protein
MTLAAFDPRNITLYKEPKHLLHFQWGGGGSIYRYALVEVIPPSEINPQTKQKADEVNFEQQKIWEVKYKICSCGK